MGASSFLNGPGLKPGVCTSTTRPSAPYEGMMIYETDTNMVLVYDGTYWISMMPKSAGVLTEESTSSTSFTDLATAGPAVTLQTGTSAIVSLSAEFQHGTAGAAMRMGVAVSGATTLAASTDNCLLLVNTNANYEIQYTRLLLLTGLTAGSNTFTAKYNVGSGSGSFFKRNLTVWAVAS